MGTAGAPTAQHKPRPPVHNSALGDYKRSVGNALDSSAPSLRRGKEKEQPKKKRPSALRRVSTGLHSDNYLCCM